MPLLLAGCGRFGSPWDGERNPQAVHVGYEEAFVGTRMRSQKALADVGRCHVCSCEYLRRQREVGKPLFVCVLCASLSFRLLLR